MLDRCRATVFSLSTSSAATCGVAAARGDEAEHLDLAGGQAAGQGGGGQQRRGEVGHRRRTDLPEGRACGGQLALGGGRVAEGQEAAADEQSRDGGVVRRGRPRPQLVRLAEVGQPARGIPGGELDGSRGPGRRPRSRTAAPAADARDPSSSSASGRARSTVARRQQDLDGPGRIRHRSTGPADEASSRSTAATAARGPPLGQPQQRQPGLRVDAEVGGALVGLVGSGEVTRAAAARRRSRGR